MWLLTENVLKIQKCVFKVLLLSADLLLSAEFSVHSKYFCDILSSHLATQYTF